MEGKRRAVGAFLGSAVKMPSISFQIWSSDAVSPTATRAAVRSEYLDHYQSKKLENQRLFVAHYPLPILPERKIPPGRCPKYPVIIGTLLSHERTPFRNALAREVYNSISGTSVAMLKF